MNRLLVWLGLRDPHRVDERAAHDSLLEETRGLRVAMERVGDELREVAVSIREANQRSEASNIPWEDMTRGRDMKGRSRRA